jgi:hypothetical protein
MALGNNFWLYPALKSAGAPLGFIRYPIKFVVVAMLAIPVLAAYGVGWLQAADNPRRAQKTVQIIVFLLLALTGLIVWRAWAHPMEGDDWPATWRNAAGRAAFLVLAPATLLLCNRAAKFNLQILSRLGLLLLLWLDVYTHAPNLSPTMQRSMYEPGMMRQALHLSATPGAAEPRFMDTVSTMDKVNLTSLDNPEQDYLCRRLALFDDCNLLDGVPKIDGFYSLYLRETEQTISALYSHDGGDVDLKGLKDFLGVGHINPPEPSRAEALDWLARDTVQPLVTAGEEPVFAAADVVLSNLVRADFDPRRFVYLPVEARRFITAKRADAKILSQKIEAERLELEVSTDAAALVVVAQSYYHPWHAYVDGKRVELWRANGAYQALEIPAGRHEVKLLYEDRVFGCGLLVSLLGLVVLALIWSRPQVGGYSKR